MVEIEIMGNELFLTLDGYEMKDDELKPVKKTFLQQGMIRERPEEYGILKCTCDEWLFKKELWILRADKSFHKIRYFECSCGKKFVCIDDLTEVDKKILIKKLDAAMTVDK